VLPFYNAPVYNHCKPCVFAVRGEEDGEVLKIHNISRYCEDEYECVANNGIEPVAAQRIAVTVHCTLLMALTSPLPSVVHY